MSKDIGAIIGGLVILALGILFIPLIALMIGFLIGGVIELATGTFTSETMNLIANTDRFARGDFAKLTAVLGALTPLFKSWKSSEE